MKRVMVDLEGLTLLAHEAEMLKHPEVGGLILFSRNFDSLTQIQALTRSIRQANPDILIAVDQEGGRVQRFREGFTPLPPMQWLGDAYLARGEEALLIAENCGWLMASEVLACGVDFSFAPVLDVDRHKCAVIANRSFSEKPAVVCKVAEAFIRGMNQAGMAATGKHFPGHGAVEGDSHLVTPVDDRSFDVIKMHDILPFHYLIERNLLKGIMPAHVVYSRVDEMPAGFSSIWIQQLLREELGFDGMVFSDDLTMEGAAISGGYRDRAKAALDAGCDMLLVCNNPEAAREVLECVNQYPVAETSHRRQEPMRAAGTLSWGALVDSERWQVASEQLAKLNAVV
ncbi:MAG: beta-N-acetylhexosaminidase [Pseudomonadales bacterium]|nr:beta-N-acetylhexosaminidase [Pseudomonadales bacterium]